MIDVNESLPGGDVGVFLNFILKNTRHNISSLSEILNIPKKRLASSEHLTKYDEIKIINLRKLLEKN